MRKSSPQLTVEGREEWSERVEPNGEGPNEASKMRLVSQRRDNTEVAGCEMDR
jgi:hypothetical protein